MYYFLVFLGGLLAGFIVGFFMYRNNKVKLDILEKELKQAKENVSTSIKNVKDKI